MEKEEVEKFVKWMNVFTGVYKNDEESLCGYIYLDKPIIYYRKTGAIFIGHAKDKLCQIVNLYDFDTFENFRNDILMNVPLAELMD